MKSLAFGGTFIVSGRREKNDFRLSVRGGEDSWHSREASSVVVIVSLHFAVRLPSRIFQTNHVESEYICR